jgi:hypothetical protein
MGFTVRAAGRAAIGACALWILAGLAGCEGALGTSPPHAAPANPSAEGEDGAVVLTWNAVTDATRYVILWDTGLDGDTLANEITGIQDTTFTHSGLENLVLHRYRIVAETSGGRGPVSRPVSAVPGPVPGSVEWVAVTAQDPGHTVHFAPTTNATHYRVYFAGIESQLRGRRPAAPFEEADGSPHVREDVQVTTAAYYRVVAMNDTRIGTGGPVAGSPTAVISEHELPFAGVALGTADDDLCLDLPTAAGGTATGSCGNYTARDLEDAGLTDLIAGPRRVSDVRFADVNGDGLDDLFSNTNSHPNREGSNALLHVNQGEGVFQTSAAVTALGIGGIGGTILTADFDNDGDVDIFAPHDQTDGGNPRSWLLINDGAGVFTDTAQAAGLADAPAGAAFVPRGGQAADFDEDGFVDMLFGSRLMLNNGDGTFRDGSAAANFPVLEDNGLRLVDVDLDGDLDLIHHSGAETRLFRNAGGVFDGGEVVGAETEATSGFGLTVCDVNGDGFEDVMLARNAEDNNRGSPKLLVNVAGSLLLSATQEGVPSNEDSLVAYNERLACGDQNNDGLADVITRWGEAYRLLRGVTALSRNVRLRIVDGAGHRNQQGRIVRVVPQDQPNRIMTRVVESGSGLRSQGMYEILVGAPWPGEYDVTVRFADGDVTTTVEAGDAKIIFADGRVEDIDPET